MVHGAASIKFKMMAEVIVPVHVVRTERKCEVPTTRNGSGAASTAAIMM